MSHNEFHKLRDKLYDVQMPVEADLWHDIEATLRRRRVRKLFYYASSVAAVVVLALLLILPGRDIVQPQEQTLVADVVSRVETVEDMVEETETVEAEVTVEVQATKLEDVVPVVKNDREEEVEAKEIDAVQQHIVAAEEKIVEKSEEMTPTPAKDNTPAEQKKTVPEKRYIAALNDDILELEDDQKREGRGYTFAVSQGIIPGSSASVAGSRVMASSAFGGALEQSHMVEQVSDTKYSLPVNAGLQLQFPVGENMAIGVGVNYSMLKSKYDCLIDKVHYKVKQKLHYIGIPVNVYGLVVERNNFSFYVNAGIALEKGIRAVYELDSYKDSRTYRTDIDGVQFSMNAGLGVEYKFNNSVGLYFEPNLVYYTNSEVMYSIRTDQPFQVKADIGFRLHF